MNSDAAFRPARGNTNHAFSVTTSASNPAVQLSGAPGAALMAIRVLNTGSNPLYFSHGGASTTLVEVPSAGSPKNGIRIPAGGVEAMTVPANSYFSFISTVGATTAEINIGEGV